MSRDSFMAWLQPDENISATLGGRRTDIHRLAKQGWVVALLYGRVEGGHVQMADHAVHRAERLTNAPLRTKACTRYQHLSRHLPFDIFAIRE